MPSPLADTATAAAPAAPPAAGATRRRHRPPTLAALQARRQALCERSELQRRALSLQVQLLDHQLTTQAQPWLRRWQLARRGLHLLGWLPPLLSLAALRPSGRHGLARLLRASTLLLRLAPKLLRLAPALSRWWAGRTASAAPDQPAS